MSYLDIIRAWKDEQYRASLSAEELARLPENPAGQIELEDRELGDVDGGTTGWACIISLVTFNFCGSFTETGTCDFGTSGCCSQQTC